MKKVFLFFFFVFVLLLSLSMVACSNSAGGVQKSDTSTDDSVTQSTDNKVGKEFTITWKNYDGTVIKSEKVLYGDMPLYDGDIPQKESDNFFTYTFSGWSPNIRKVTNNITYFAQFEQNTRLYTVTWKNWDGRILKVDYMKYNSFPIYTGDAPIKPDDQLNKYNFSGWEPVVTNLKDNAVYTAKYDASNNGGYTITWINWDGTILETDNNVPYDSMPEYNGDIPTKTSDSEYSYFFDGWTTSIERARGNKTYTAKFRSSIIPKYTITWINWEGTILEIDTNVPYGTIPSYDGSIPQKNVTGNSYIFNGWSPNIGTVIQDTTYIAQFERACIVTWKNWDETILEIDAVAYGSTPSYDGSIPQKASTEINSFVFNGWFPSIETVVQDITYVAVFEKTDRKYIVTWKNWDETVLEIDDDLLYGDIPEYNGTLPKREKTAQYTFEFIGWSPEISSIISDTIYIAQYNSIINTYTVIWKNWDGTILEIDNNAKYGYATTYHGDVPIKKQDSVLYRYEFTGWNPSNKIIYGDSIFIAQFNKIDSDLLFGSYPQTLVTDSNIISYLNNNVGEMPSRENSYDWNTYISQHSYNMWYQDIAYNGDKYRGVYLSGYKGLSVKYSTNSADDSSDKSVQDDYGYIKGNIYWFKFEPIKWRYLYGVDQGVLVADLILDAQDYYCKINNCENDHNGGVGYDNNYALSHIREWLNEEFYTTAFNDDDKNLIICKEIDNDSKNIYACDNTYDNVFLLSYDEVGCLSSVIAASTDYAKCQGLSSTNEYVPHSAWWLRTPSVKPLDSPGSSAFIVPTNGAYNEIYDSSHMGVSAIRGVRPAIWAKL